MAIIIIVSVIPTVSPTINATLVLSSSSVLPIIEKQLQE